MSNGVPARWASEVDARLARLELRADEVDAPSLSALLGEDAGPSTPADTSREHANLESWVADYFCTTFVRPLGGEWRWCSQWREHHEAVVRFTALWDAWQALRQDEPFGMATWLHTYLDPQLTVLLGSRGPFAGCSATRHDLTLLGGMPARR